MKSEGLTNAWAERFGLAAAPLWEEDQLADGEHAVLLDGVQGTFALSVSDDPLWRDGEPAGWIWSSDVAHHVTVTQREVGVLRWDRRADARVFDRASVERNLERFYDFLIEDRLRSNRSVVEHLLSYFRRLRSLGHAARIEDARATELFTAALARIMSTDEEPSIESFGVEPEAVALLHRLDARGLAAATEEVASGPGTLAALRLHPTLAVRHAGGQLFQEAHFELLRAANDYDLFGLIGASDVAPKSRGGAHFTPPTLARSLMERALQALPEPVASRAALTVCDPACGSGAFLHEALRTLRREGFTGRLRLVGYDVSAAAITMARFVVSAALRDWAPEGGVEITLQVGDSLGERGIPAADIIIMNPPFIGFAAQTPEQREQLTAAVGAASAGRGDYCMAFIQRALEALPPGGVLGALFPASLLSLRAAAGWREGLLAMGDLNFLAAIGDFGLFSHALVQVAAAVFAKGAQARGEFLALITENEPQATSLALRQLRRLGPTQQALAHAEESWSLFPVPTRALRSRPTWRLPTPRAERVLRALTQSGLPTVSEIFDVSQGIQTGFNDALLLTGDEWNALPVKERRFFRQATMTDSIKSGHIAKPYWLFFPHAEDGNLFANEEAVRTALPRYFAAYLQPHQDRLAQRASIRRSRRRDWWGLMHPRAWSLADRPRIITKFFGAEGAFVADPRAAFFAVMGHVWTMRVPERRDPEDEVAREDFGEPELLEGYAALCNSALFVRLLGLYAPSVAGGQFDLSARYVAPIPLPDLRALAVNPATARAVKELCGLGQRVELGDTAWRRRVADVTGLLYGDIGLDAF